jgi:HEAT repeat protein
MPSRQTGLTDLTAEERAELEHPVTSFDLRWRPGALADAVRRLPAGARWRWAAIVEMVKIDLERRWDRGEQPRLDEYLNTIPELGPIADLIASEIDLRHRPIDRQGDAQRDPRPAGSLAAGSRAPVDTIVAPDTPNAIAVGTRVEEPTPPATLGRYQLVRLLGRGGMGTVYLARDPKLERDVALKIPSADLRADPRAGEQILGEARAAAGLHHPNICPVYDVGAVDDFPYITSAYIDGEPLSAMARRSPRLSERDAARLVATVARAIDFAHERGIVHRDLKPSNIMIDRHGNPVVMDFGLARRVPTEPAPSNTDTGPVGSPAYIAPEQVAASKAGPASDIFSLGVVLYEVLTGRLPFPGPSIADVFRQVVHDPPPRPSQLRPGLDPALEAICLKALAKWPPDRYRSMGEMATALEAIAAPRPWAVRRAAAVVVLLGVATAGTWFAWDRLRARPEIPPDPGPQTVDGGGASAGGVAIAPPPRPARPRVYVPEYRRTDRGFSESMLNDKPGFSQTKRPTTVEGWVAVLNTANVDDRLIAVEELAKLQDPAAIGVLARRMLLKPAEVGQFPEAEHWSVRRECAAALGFLGFDSPAAADALAERVADEWWRTEVHNKNNPWRTPVLTNYQDPQHSGKDAALDALAAIAPERVVPALLIALARKDKPGRKPPTMSHRPLVRAWAAERLAGHDSPETVKALCDALTDEYPLVRRRAAESLLKLKSAAAANALAARVADDLWMPQESVLLRGELSPSTYQDPEWGGKEHALAALRAVAPDLVPGALSKAARSENPAVRDWANARTEMPKK